MTKCPATVSKSRAARFGTAMLLAAGALFFPGASGAGNPIAASVPSGGIRAFGPGEKLTYAISWSRIISAGTALMEVKKELSAGGEEMLRFVTSARTTGVLDAVFRARETVESLFDPRIMQSILFSIDEIHGNKKRSRTTVFDHANGTAENRVNNGPPETRAIPDPVQDALSSLYYLRATEHLTVGKPRIIEVHDSGKNWSVEFQPLAREQVTTPAGLFPTIKVRTHPKYEGILKSKGEMFLWLTDDERKIPVLIKSTVSIGSLVLTLTRMQLGDGPP